jgi:hypothetical protein
MESSTSSEYNMKQKLLLQTLTKEDQNLSKTFIDSNFLGNSFELQEVTFLFDEKNQFKESFWRFADSITQNLVHLSLSGVTRNVDQVTFPEDHLGCLVQFQRKKGQISQSLLKNAPSCPSFGDFLRFFLNFENFKSIKGAFLIKVDSRGYFGVNTLNT